MLRPRTVTFNALLVMTLAAVVGQIAANSRSELHQKQLLHRFAISSPVDALSESSKTALRERAAKYEQLIEADHLLDGMVVNLNMKTGKPTDVCDSLIFSSLRYIALTKLGWHEQALRAWAAIEKSQENGMWLRHPQCRKSTSRDMILGVLAAFTQNPPHMRNHLVSFISQLENNGGFVSPGRIDVSYLMPGVAEITRIFAKGNGILEYSLPTSVAYGFSTIEFSAIAPQPGYRSHLVGLTSWIEIELLNQQRYQQSNEVRSVISEITRFISIFSGADLYNQRLSWITGKLYYSDPNNLFFKWLKLRSSNAISPATRQHLADELLAIKEFPTDALPTDCVRRADYMWQRDSREYSSRKKECVRQFSGVDFLWMAALVLDESHDFKIDPSAQANNH